MKKQLIRALVIAALLVTSLATQTARADDECRSGYQIINGIAVCCDDGGCETR